MDLFKNIIKKEKAESEVLSFQPKAIQLALSESAKVYLNEDNRKKSDFVLSELIAKQTGVSNVESEAHKSRIEQEVLKRLQETQENAYSEAYALGREEGSKAAFEEVHADLENKISDLSNVLADLKSLRTQVLKAQEKELIELIFQIGKKIALKELSEDASVIQQLLESILADNEKDQEVKISLSKQDYEFIQGLIKDHQFKFTEMNQVKFIIDPSISSGGCVVQTEYGSIDSQVERRVENLWDALKSRMPHSGENSNND